MILFRTIREWLAGRDTRSCIVIYRDRANKEDNATILSVDIREITDMLIEAMENSPKLSFAIVNASNIYKRNRYHETHPASIGSKGRKPKNVVRY